MSDRCDGNARGVTAGSAFQNSRSTVRRVPVVRCTHHGAWVERTRGGRRLFKSNRNNDSLNAQLPVTTGYGTVLARLSRGLRCCVGSSYQVLFLL